MKFTEIPYSRPDVPALLAAYVAAVLLACHLGLRARLRNLPRESIVESIREL